MLIELSFLELREGPTPTHQQGTIKIYVYLLSRLSDTHGSFFSIHARTHHQICEEACPIPSILSHATSIALTEGKSSGRYKEKKKIPQTKNMLCV